MPILPKTKLGAQGERLALPLVTLAILFAAQVWAVDQMKTQEFFVGDTSNGGAVSTATNQTFNLYIGDNITGISNAVKSAYFSISGVYTNSGNPTLQLQINSNASSTKTFTFPAVSNPTPFHIFYPDSAGIINPVSGGSYSYTLNITPANMTIYGLGSKLVATNQFTPPACPDGQPTNEKVKTLEYLVMSTSSAVSAQVDSPFSVYIGDNIVNVTSSMKSDYFLISGLYTGGAGSIQFQLNSANSQTFTLPAVSGPTPFEILYPDSTGVINPTTPGSYSYTLSTIPSGVTIYGLAAKAQLTFRYKPASCSNGYPISGDLVSPEFDTTATSSASPAYNSIKWTGNLGGPSQDQGNVRFQFAASASSSGPFNFIGGPPCPIGDWFSAATTTLPNAPVELNCPANYNNLRYFEYKIRVCSNDCSASGNYTPTVTGVIVNWSP